MIQLAEIHTIQLDHTVTHHRPAEEEFHLTHSERMRLYTSAWFDLGCVAFLALLMFLALFV